MIRKLYGCLATILLLAHPGLTRASASGGETIRVAVFIDQPSLTIKSPGSLTLLSTQGAKLARLKKPLEIFPGTSGLILNQRSTGIKELLLRTDSSPMTLNGTAFAGTFRIEQRPGGLLAINEIGLEDYLKGVVPVEISPQWHPEVLKVQAIAARTYALYRRQINTGRGYDLVSTTADQVYGGQSREHPAANQAIAETRGLVLSYQGRLVLSAYHSTSAGPTENVQEVWGMDIPYLKGVNCPFDRRSPRFQWLREMALDHIQAAFSRNGYPIGMIATLTPFDRTPSGRVGRIRVLHSEGEIILRGEELRRILGYSELPSTQFNLEHNRRDVKIQGRGSGHGVGLCQWGAKEMAELGYRFERILKYFYPGVKVVSYGDLIRREDP